MDMKEKLYMAQETLFKTIHQYSSGPVAQADMEKLREIARDYRRVKNEVYQRYGGIYGLSKIYPGYTAQNEMTQSGLRARLGLPAVYFYCAVFSALGDIKSQWSHTKNRVEKSIRENGKRRMTASGMKWTKGVCSDICKDR